MVLIGLDVPAQLVRLTGQLESEYEGRVSREDVDSIVNTAMAHYTEARVTKYVPVLVEREARLELKHFK